MKLQIRVFDEEHEVDLEEMEISPFMVVCSGEHKIHMIQSESI